MIVRTDVTERYKSRNDRTNVIQALTQKKKYLHVVRECYHCSYGAIVGNTRPVCVRIVSELNEPSLHSWHALCATVIFSLTCASKINKVKSSIAVDEINIRDLHTRDVKGR